MCHDRTPSLYLRCKKTGEIMFVAGSSAAFFERELSVGELIENISPINALLPMKKNKLTIPRLEISKDFWVDIILESYADHLYVLLIDCSTEAKSIREKSQHRNLEILNSKKNGHGKK